MSSIITVKILDIKPHPNATKLRICTVTDQNQETQVVCGAKNARIGMITVLAEVGSTTPVGTKISVSDLRGTQSHGMLCSAKDLGIMEEAGIVDLPKNTPLGVYFGELSKFDLSSTPWFDYQEVEAFWEDDIGRIWVYRDEKEPTKEDQLHLLSKTYYNDGEYLYRSFT